MPATHPQQPKPIDWSELRALYVKGLTLKDLSDRFGIPFATVRSRSAREKWSNTVATARELVVQDASTKLAASANSWIGKVDQFVHNSLDSIMRRDADKLAVKDLASLMTAAAQCATIARNHYGMDKDTGKAKPAMVQVNISNVGVAPCNVPSIHTDVIDVDVAPSGDSDTAPSAS